MIAHRLQPSFTEDVTHFLELLGNSPSLRLKEPLRVVMHSLDASHDGVYHFLSGQQAQRVIHIWEDIWYARREQVESRLRSLAGMSRRLHARNCEVKRIDKLTTDHFLKTNHLQGTSGAYYKYGLYSGDELVAVATFSKSRVMKDGAVPYRSYEWERFASKTGTTVTGGLGKLLAYFIDLIHPAHIMTYIDLDWSTGSGYEKLGFRHTGTTQPVEYFVKPGDWIRVPVHHMHPGETEQDYINSGYYRIANSGSRKMVLFPKYQTS